MKGEPELVRIYAAASRELAAQLRSVDPMAMTGIDAERMRLFAARLVTVLNEQVVGWADEYLAAAYVIGERRARAALDAMGKRPVRPAITRGDIGIIADTVADLMNANLSIKRSVGDYVDMAILASQTMRSAQVQEFRRSDVKDGIDRLADQAIRQTKSRTWLSKQLSDLLSQYVNEEGFIQIIGKDGIARNYNARKYAKMVARTSLRQAQTAATKEITRRYQHDLVEVSDHDGCEDCEEWEGKVFSLSGRTPGYPILDREPPFHPNCKHSILPTSEAAEEIRERERRGEYA